VAIGAEDIPTLVALANERAIDLTIIGPEVPLALGLADALRAAGRSVFGPSQAPAQIEASKAFSKSFMARHHIPTARFAIFSEFPEALKHLLSVDYPIVIKASGLAAGKGVILPDCADDAEAALRSIMLAKEFGAAGDEVLIEERLSGPEVSLLAFPTASRSNRCRLRKIISASSTTIKGPTPAAWAPTRPRQRVRRSSLMNSLERFCNRQWMACG
jgi:phosphoribosylamine-glycine ligase